MPGGTEDDLLGWDGGVGDEVVVGGDDLVDVDKVFGLCWLSCACMHGHSVSRATGRISPFRCAKHWPFRGWDAVVGEALSPTMVELWEGSPRGPPWKCRRSRAVGRARPVGAMPAARAADRRAGGGGLEAGGHPESRKRPNPEAWVVWPGRRRHCAVTRAAAPLAGDAAEPQRPAGTRNP